MVKTCLAELLNSLATPSKSKVRTFAMPVATPASYPHPKHHKNSNFKCKSQPTQQILQQHPHCYLESVRPTRYLNPIKYSLSWEELGRYGLLWAYKGQTTWLNIALKVAHSPIRGAIFATRCPALKLLVAHSDARVQRIYCRSPACPWSAGCAKPEPIRKVNSDTACTRLTF